MGENDALINTVRVVKAKNKKMHEALSPASAENSEEWKELDKKLKAAQEKQKFKRNQFNELQRQIQDLRETISHADQNEGLASGKLEQVSHELDKIDRSVAEQKVKLTRAMSSLERFDRSKLSAHQNTDLDLREIRSLLAGAGRQLSSILRQHEEITIVAGSMMQQCGLDPDLIIQRNSSSSNIMGSPRSRSSLNSSKQPSPRTPPRVNPSLGTSRPPSIASSTSSRGGRSAPRRTPITSPLASARSTASDLSLTGSKLGK